LALASVGIGLLGFLFTYGRLGDYIDFISSPVYDEEARAEPATLMAAAGTFMEPFLGFGLVLAWSLWLTRPGRPKGLLLCGAVTGALLMMLLFANFSYNRAYILAPMLGVAAAFSIHVRRLSVTLLLLAAIPVFSLVLAFGWYRSTRLDISELGSASQASAVDYTWVDFVQVYAQAPQFSAYMIEQTASHYQWYFGETLVCSMLYPLPALGRPFRERSGVILYNRAIYGEPGVGETDTVDQVLPYDTEFYINLGVPAVVAGFALLGCLMAWFQRHFLLAASPIESYCWLILGFWCAFPGSLPVLSQQYIYFCWPIYVYFALKALGARASETRATSRDRDYRQPDAVSLPAPVG
jgi:hypothetical protein